MNFTKQEKYKWRFKNHPHIQITELSKTIVNVKTGRTKKECLNGYSIGYWITSKKFILTENINNHVELIPKTFKELLYEI